MLTYVYTPKEEIKFDFPECCVLTVTILLFEILKLCHEYNILHSKKQLNIITTTLLSIQTFKKVRNSFYKYNYKYTQLFTTSCDFIILYSF